MKTFRLFLLSLPILTLSACVIGSGHHPAPSPRNNGHLEFTPTSVNPAAHGIEFQIEIMPEMVDKGPYVTTLWVKGIGGRDKRMWITSVVWNFSHVEGVRGRVLARHSHSGADEYSFMGPDGANISAEPIPFYNLGLGWAIHPDQDLEIKIYVVLESPAGRYTRFSVSRTFEISEERDVEV